MQIDLNHNLPQTNATECAKKILDNLKEEHAGKISDVKQSWNGNTCNFSFKAYNFAVSGTIVVTEKQINIKGNLPFLARAFSGTIKSTIENNAVKLINDCRQNV